MDMHNGLVHSGVAGTDSNTLGGLSLGIPVSYNSTVSTFDPAMYRLM